MTKRENGGVDWPALAQLIDDAGLGRRDPALVGRVFTGSFVVCFLYVDGRLVGAGRAISDGVTSSAIYDIVVAPDYQGRGLGRRIMEDLLERLPRRSVMLVSVPKQRGFYEKLGFATLKTAMLKHEDMAFWVSNGYVE
jgi:ribosomal protein S18 acetylase RimI-like enzyme